MPAQNLGAMTRLSGSTAIISIADNCSEAFNCPISAVKAEPALPANNKAATTGPNSLMMAKDTKLPKEPVAIKSFRMLKPCKPKTMPINKPETIMMITD